MRFLGQDFSKLPYLTSTCTLEFINLKIPHIIIVVLVLGSLKTTCNSYPIIGVKILLFGFFPLEKYSFISTFDVRKIY